jgi:hypothetical protein
LNDTVTEVVAPGARFPEEADRLVQACVFEAVQDNAVSPEFWSV